MATRLTFYCPHCKGNTKTRTSRGLSATLRELIYQCDDPECSYSFLVLAEAVRTLSPSGKPDPAVNLPRHAQGGAGQVQTHAVCAPSVLSA